MPGFQRALRLIGSLCVSSFIFVVNIQKLLNFYYKLTRIERIDYKIRSSF